MEAQHYNTYDLMQEKPKSVGAIVGLVCGIIALLTSFLPIINNGSFILALVGLITGIVGMVGISRGKKSGKAIAIVAIVVSAVSLVVVLATQAMFSQAIDQAYEESFSKIDGSATEQILEQDCDVTIGALSVSVSSYGLVTSELPVTVKNITNETHSFSIHLEAVNAAGDRIKDDYVYANDLGAGQSQTYKTFTYIPEEDVEAMEAATIQVVSVSEY